MTNNPTFTAGQECWHVRRGKVTLLKSNVSMSYPVAIGMESFTEDGKAYIYDKGRVLYTLEEARQYGWLKEPLVVEFECGVHHVGDGSDGRIMRHELAELAGKHVKVRVEECL